MISYMRGDFDGTELRDQTIYHLPSKGAAGEISVYRGTGLPERQQHDPDRHEGTGGGL